MATNIHKRSPIIFLPNPTCLFTPFFIRFLAVLAYFGNIFWKCAKSVKKMPFDAQRQMAFLGRQGGSEKRHLTPKASIWSLCLVNCLLLVPAFEMFARIREVMLYKCTLSRRIPDLHERRKACDHMYCTYRT